MKSISVKNESGRLVAGQVWVADTFSTRLRGLLGRKPLEGGEGLLLIPCNSIHTFFMSFPIDVAFLNRDGLVISVHESIYPWRIRVCPQAWAALELKAGSLEQIEAGPGVKLSLFGLDYK